MCGGIGGALALMANGFSAAAKTRNWHAANKRKAKEKQRAIREKYRSQFSKNEFAELQSLPFTFFDESSKEAEINCPECQKAFKVVSLKGLELDYCGRCRSFWFDAGELAALSGEDEDVPSSHLKSRVSKYECPCCQKSMEEYVYKTPHNLLVDQCDSGCGVYLESGEMERVLRVNT
ncbi:MAG: zf-TFIIB domain-containing protein [Planctomycetes bacterium]|nr:zf-TFIIB domain-containing protein [Planctomycetota bacterium]